MVSVHLLAFDLTGLRRLDPRLPNLLASGRAIDPRRTFGANLLTLDPSRTLSMSLRTLNPRRPFGTNLLAFGPGRPFRANVLAFCPLRPLGDPLNALCARGLPLGTRRLLALSLLTRLLSFGSCGLPVLLRPRIGRGGDRQCGYARGEEYPGHHNFSF